MTENEHTPPWRWETTARVDCRVRDADGGWVCDVYAPGGSGSNAVDRILLAVNSHAPLLAACRGLVDASTITTRDGLRGFTPTNRCRHCDIALSHGAHAENCRVPPAQAAIALGEGRTT